MKLYLYAPKKTMDAVSIASAIGAERLGRYDGIDFWARNSRVIIEPGSVVVCWGSSMGEIPGVKVINSAGGIHTRFKQLMALQNHGFAVPQLILPEGGHSTEDFVKAGYVPRVQGKTMLELFQEVPKKADYFMMKVSPLVEYRVHFHDGCIIASGQQLPREGWKVGAAKKWTKDGPIYHPFVRTFEAGWETSYNDGFLSTQLAKSIPLVQKALKLRFGAVSVLECSGGATYISKVDSAPTLDKTLLPLYVRAIRTMLYEGAK